MIACLPGGQAVNPRMRTSNQGNGGSHSPAFYGGRCAWPLVDEDLDIHTWTIESECDGLV